MTDTTDIKELIEPAMLSCSEGFASEIVDSLTFDIGRDLDQAEHAQVFDAVSRLLDTPAQLEAERQRADESQAGFWGRTAARETIRAKKAEAELAALKGEQVPVVKEWFCEKCKSHHPINIEVDIYPYCCGEGMTTSLFPRRNKDINYEVISPDTMAMSGSGMKEFLAPQKPVVLPEGFYPDGDIDCELVINLSDAIAAIEAAGGKVAE